MSSRCNIRWLNCPLQREKVPEQREKVPEQRGKVPEQRCECLDDRATVFVAVAEWAYFDGAPPDNRRSPPR